MKQNYRILLLILLFAVISCNKNGSEQQPQTKAAELNEPNKTETIVNTETNTNSGSESVDIKINSKTAGDSKNNTGTKSSEPAATNNTPKYPIVTFVELGSVNCIPCKKMQPIMKSLENKYGDQLKVIFYDVMKQENKIKSEEFGIKLIPTQVFLDANGKEIHRHEGYYPEEDIDKLLQSRGLKIKN